MNEDNTSVGIFSSKNIVTERLENKFKELNLEVYIFNNLNYSYLSKLNYLIFNLIQDPNRLNDISRIINNLNCKILILFPLYVNKSDKEKVENELDSLIKLHPNLGIIMVPEILGKDVEYNDSFITHRIIKQSLLSQSIKIEKEVPSINIISMNKLVKYVVRETLSFGVTGKRLLLRGTKKGIQVFITKYLKINSRNISYINKDFEFTEIYFSDSVNIDFSLSLATKNTKDTFFEIFKNDKLLEDEKKVDLETITKEEVLIPDHIQNNNKEVKVKKTKNIRFRKYFKKILLSLLVIILIISIPLFLIFFSISSLYISTKTIEKSKIKTTHQLIKSSLFFSQAAKNLSFNSSFYYNLSNLLNNFSAMGEESLSLLKLSEEFMSKIMGDEIYDFEFYSNNISAGLDKISKDISFFQSDIDEQNGYFGNYIRNKLDKKNISIGDIRNKIYEFKNLVSRTSYLLASEKPKKYLLLFQNNMELRPTGGFIGSFAIITFDKGRLTEIVVNDVYSADGQLKGHVDPPEPIKNYLNEANWYLRDSNWDPDFVKSSSKIEWFLDKEIDQQVDGVIAVDLYFVQSLLKITGPINLVDYKKTIDENNLYQITQSEVESEFFPGSIKKASFLTSLSRNLITEIENLPSSKYLLLFKEIYKNLEQRHIQIFFHDTNSQKAISLLGFSGEVDTNTDCGSRCILDTYSLIDANLGVNKSNYFIKRSQEIGIFVNKEYISHQLIIDYENSSSISIGSPGLYKSYTRILVPQEASIVSIREYDSNGEYKNLEFDLLENNNRLEAGFLLEVFPSSRKKIQITWILPNNKLSLGGEYKLFVRKQAGTESDTLKVTINSKDLTLTGKAVPVYNTTLAKDFSARLFFK